MKIKVINPNTTLEMTKSIDDAAKNIARTDTEIFSVSPTMGPESIESYYDDYMSIPGILDEIKKGDQEGFEAYVIACYADPGVHAARELTSAPVLGIAEASLYLASILAARFSIITTPYRMKTVTEDLIQHYGMNHRVQKIKALPIAVIDFEKNPSCANLLKEEAIKSVQEDDAEAILLGCAGMAQFAEDLQNDLGVPVIDGVVAAVKIAESIVDMHQATSKLKTYDFPEIKSQSGLLESFSINKK